MKGCLNECVFGGLTRLPETMATKDLRAQKKTCSIFKGEEGRGRKREIDRERERGLLLPSIGFRGREKQLGRIGLG